MAALVNVDVEIQAVVKLDTQELTYLRSLLQNSFKENEPQFEEIMRTDLFNTFNKALQAKAL